MNARLHISFLLLIVFGFLGFVNTSVFAQDFSIGGVPTGIEEQISVSVSPQIPQAGDQVFISVRSFSSDLNKAEISWFENSAVVLTGIGETGFTTFAPRAGVSKTVQVQITTLEGNSITRDFTIAPANVELVYEAETYTPPFYTGRAMYTHQAPVRVFALPTFIENGVTIPQSELSYEWEINRRAAQDASGYGRDSFLYQSDVLSQPVTISVTVTSTRSSLIATNSITLTPTTPEILLYQDHPIYGLLYRSLNENTYELTGGEVTMTAIPLFFAGLTRSNPLLFYDWTMNGRPLDVYTNLDRVVFRNTSGVDGTANVRVNIDHNTLILQSGAAGTNLLFRSTGDTGIEQGGGENSGSNSFSL